MSLEEQVRTTVICGFCAGRSVIEFGQNGIVQAKIKLESYNINEAQ